MAGTRRSTRQAAAAVPKYNEDDSPSENEGPKPKGAKATRRKRAREDEEAEVEDDSPPSKKTTRTKPPKPAPAPSKSQPSKPTPKPTPATTSPTNRDASGAQETFWLLKSEPTPRYENGTNISFSFSDLRACTAPEPWSGVRNYGARNNMLAMRTGDLAFFYHSNAKPSGIVGVCRIVREAEVDESAFEVGGPYYDAKSTREEPKWRCVSVEYVRGFEGVVELGTIKENAVKGGALEGMQLVTQSRLSVCRVTRGEWEFILGLAGVDGKELEKGSGGEEVADEMPAEVGEEKAA